MDYLSKYSKYKNKYIQIKYNLYGGTNYSKQYKLEEEGEIPELKFNGVDIRTNIIIVIKKPIDYSLFWTDDNEKNIKKYYNPEKIKCNWVEFKDISDQEYSKNNYLFNCIRLRRVYKIIFNTKENLDCFIKNIETIVETPIFEDLNPYPFIYHVKILNKKFNSFYVFFSYYLQYEICKSIMIWGNNLLNKYLKEFYEFKKNSTLDQIIISNNYPVSNVKLQMCIKDEYLFWVVEKLCKNYNELKLIGLNKFKFFLPSNNKFNKDSEFYPDHDKEKNERIDSYYIDCKKYKRELFLCPTIVFYLSYSLGSFNKLINKLKCLFPDNLDITNGFPRFNIRLTKNIFFSIGGDNKLKYSNRNFDKKTIPLEYKYILDKYDKVDINECKKLNEYSRNLTDHDLLILDNGKYIINNILSYYNIIPTYESFKQVFEKLELEEFYVSPP